MKKDLILKKPTDNIGTQLLGQFNDESGDDEVDVEPAAINQLPPSSSQEQKLGPCSGTQDEC